MNFKLILISILCIILGIIFIHKFLRREKVNGGYLSKYILYGKDGDIGSVIGIELAIPIPVLKYDGARQIILKNSDTQYYISALFKDLDVINVIKDPLKHLINVFNKLGYGANISFMSFGRHNLLLKMFRISDLNTNNIIMMNSKKSYCCDLVHKHQIKFNFEDILNHSIGNITFMSYVLDLLHHLMEILKDDAFIADVSFIGQLVGYPKEAREPILNAIANREVINMNNEDFDIINSSVVEQEQENEPSIEEPPETTKKRGRPKGSKNKVKVNDQKTTNTQKKINSGGCLWGRTSKTVGGCPPKVGPCKTWFMQHSPCNVCGDCAVHNLVFFADDHTINKTSIIKSHVYFNTLSDSSTHVTHDLVEELIGGEIKGCWTQLGKTFKITMNKPFSHFFDPSKYVLLIETNDESNRQLGHWIGFHNRFVFDSQCREPMNEIKWLVDGPNEVFILYYIVLTDIQYLKDTITDLYEKLVGSVNGFAISSYGVGVSVSSRVQDESVRCHEDNNK